MCEDRKNLDKFLYDWGSRIYDFILIRLEALLKRMVISIWKEQYLKARRIVINWASLAPSLRASELL